jgi:hypothetical protein
MDRWLARSLAWSLVGILSSVSAQGAWATALAADERVTPPPGSGLTQQSVDEHLASLRQQRIALVIGAANYDHVKPPLRNPLNDAKAVAELLDGFGFTVIKKLDPAIDTLHDALDEFENAAKGHKTALIYFAGHGVEYVGENYLIPVDAELKRARHLGHQAVPLRVLFELLEAARVSSAVIMLDACRSNPFALEAAGLPRGKAGGLGEITAPTDFLIAYATEPGDIADDGEGANGVFTAAFLQHADSPGARVRDVLDRVSRTVAELTRGSQRPWKHDNMTKTIVLRYPLGELDYDHYLWSTAREMSEANIITEFKIQAMAQYLCFFPQGIHADEAISTIEQLKNHDSSFAIGDFCRFRASTWRDVASSGSEDLESTDQLNTNTLSFIGPIHRDETGKTSVNYAMLTSSRDFEAVSMGDLNVPAAAYAESLDYYDILGAISGLTSDDSGLVIESYAPELSFTPWLAGDHWDQRNADLNAALTGLIALRMVATSSEFRDASPELAVPRISLATRRIPLLGAEVLGEDGGRIAEIEDIVRNRLDQQLYVVMETGTLQSQRVAIPIDVLGVGPDRKVVLDRGAEELVYTSPPYEGHLFGLR